MIGGLLRCRYQSITVYAASTSMRPWGGTVAELARRVLIAGFDLSHHASISSCSATSATLVADSICSTSVMRRMG